MRPSHSHTHALTRTLSAALIALAAFAALAASARAQCVGYSVNVNDDQLYRIDLATGVATPVGPVGGAFPNIAGLSFGPDGRLYGVDPLVDLLVIVNPATGAATPVGSLGTDVVEGGLTFDLQGRLFYTDSLQRFFQINPQTGQATLLGNTGTNINGLTASAGGVLYGFDNNNDLHTLDPATGARTLVGPLGVDVFRGGLDFAATGTLFGVDAFGTPSLFTVNPQTGQATIIAPLASGFDNLAIECEKLTVSNVGVSDQKAGSLLVFPYYTSAADGSFSRSDTLITITSVANGPSSVGGQPYYYGANGKAAPYYGFLHLFFINGANCSPADTFVCLTPNASIQFKASDFDPTVTGYLVAVAVDDEGRPTQANHFIGSAFVRDDNAGVVDSYGAEAFWKHTPYSVQAGAGGTATISLNGADYDLAPTQFSVQVQDPATADEFIALASLSGNLGSALSATTQAGVGVLYRADETPASFQPQIGTGCFSLTAVDKSKIRVVPGTLDTFLKDSYGYLKFQVSAPAVGLLLSRQGPANQATNRWSGIRTLHKTQVGAGVLVAPCFPPFCGF